MNLIKYFPQSIVNCGDKVELVKLPTTIYNICFDVAQLMSSPEKAAEHCKRLVTDWVEESRPGHVVIDLIDLSTAECEAIISKEPDNNQGLTWGMYILIAEGNYFNDNPELSRIKLIK